MKKNVLIAVIISIAVSTAVFFGGSYLMGDFENKKVANVELTDEYRMVSGVIRNSGDGWGLIQDETHETVNINSVEQSDDKIIVKYDKNSKINSVAVTPDETMASEGFSVGASVGDAEMWIQIFDKDLNLVNPKDYTEASGNVWIQGIFKK